MQRNSLIGSSLLVLGMSTASFAQDLACGRVKILSVDRSTAASAMTFQGDATSNEGDWESHSQAMKRFGGKASEASQEGWALPDSMYFDLDTRMYSADVPASSRSEIEIRFSVGAGPDWWEECSTIEPGTDPVSPIPLDYTRVELDLIADLMARGGGNSSNPGSSARVTVQLSGNGMYYENKILEGSYGNTEYADLDQTIALDPGNYKLVIKSEHAWSPELVQGPGGSVYWEGNSGYAVCLAEVELQFRESLEPGTQFVEVLEAYRGAFAHAEGSTSGFSSGPRTTNASHFLCEESLAWSHGSGSDYAEVSQESQIRSSAFWGDFELGSSARIPNKESRSSSSMRADFRTIDDTIARIDVRSWALASRFFQNSTTDLVLKVKISNQSTGRTIFSKQQVLDPYGSAAFETDLGLWNVHLDAGKEYRFFASVSATTENGFFFSVPTYLIGEGHVKVDFAPAP